MNVQPSGKKEKTPKKPTGKTPSGTETTDPPVPNRAHTEMRLPGAEPLPRREERS